MEITYLEAFEQDIPELTRIMTLAFDDDSRKHFNSEKGGPEGYDNGDFFRKWMLGFKETTGYKIMTGNIVIGCFIVWIMPDKNNFLGTIFIDPAYQDKGIGSNAWKYIEARYPDATSWQLETPAQAKKNHYFYEKKCGFKKIKEADSKEVGKSFIYKKIYK